jgi:transcriptional regulator with XRE-family HTH domain
MIENNIRKIRVWKGISQRELAQLANTSQQQIQRIEAGTQAARVDLAERIAAALKVELHELFPGLLWLRRRSEAKRDEFAKAGVELDDAMHRVYVRLRDGTDEEFVVGRKVADRLRVFSKRIEKPRFAVFDTFTHRVALNLREVAFWQFLSDPFVTPKDDETEEPDEELKLWIVGKAEPEVFGVNYDRDYDEVSGELGNLSGFFYDLSTTDDLVRPLWFEDDDEEEIVVDPSAIAR